MSREALTGHRLCQHHGSGLSLQNSENSMSLFISHQPTVLCCSSPPGPRQTSLCSRVFTIDCWTPVTSTVPRSSRRDESSPSGGNSARPLRHPTRRP